MDRPIENKESFDVRSSEYFNSLPPFVQETIIQGTDLIENEQDLKKTAEQIINNC